MHTVIFDLDGTLADTSGDLMAAANACFRRRGLGDLLDPRADAATALRGARAMLRLGFARAGLGWGEADLAAEIAADVPRFMTFYGENIDRHTRIYPGVEAALDRLAEAGYALGICTNKTEALAEDLTRRLGLRDRFGALVGADTLPVRKPDPAPFRAAVDRAGGTVARSLLVGDTETDRQTAHAAGVPALMVTFGADGQGVAALAPEGLLHHYDGIEAEVARLIGRPG